MIIAERLFSVIIVWGLLWTEISGSTYYEDVCPKDAIVDLQGGIAISNLLVYKSGLYYPPEATWEVNDTLFGCPCALKACVPLCCPLEYASNAEGDCIEDSLTPEIIRFRSKLIDEDYHEFTSNPCESVSKDLVIRTTDFGLWPDGSLHHDDFMWPLFIGSYCLSRVPNTTVREAFICHHAPSLGWNVWMLVCLSVAIFFMLSTLIVYSVVPELKNLQGWTVRSYLVSYICLMITLVAQSLMSRFGLAFNPWQFLTLVVFLIYFGCASMMWLNVMSFDIWRKFREIRSNNDVNFKKRQRTTFIRYSIFTWGTSCILPAIYATSPTWGTNTIETWDSVELYTICVPIVGCFICNIYFYAMTARKIRQCKKETADVVDDGSKHHRKNKQWFNIYLKLFVIMGCHVILWAVGWSWMNKKFLIFVYFVEPVQSVLIFHIFVWKDDVRKSIRKRLGGVTRRLGSCIRRRPSTNIENENDECETRL